MTQIPVLAHSAAEIEQSRRNLAAELRALEGWLETAGDLDEPVLIGAEQPFHLTYQIENNRELLSTYGRLCSRMMARWRNKQTPAGVVTTRRRLAARRRLGIVSGHVHTHSVYHAITKGWIEQLDRSRFEISIFNLAAVVDEETERARRSADHFESGPLPLGEWVRRIEASDVDILLYPEIGMYPVALQLGSMRLARVQVASWGHPETTGLPTIDYFLSAQSFESPESQQAYAETLLCLPKLGTCCEAPKVAAHPAELGRFSFKGRGPVLLCGGIPFKYGPQHDSVLVELAKRLQHCQFWFFEYHGASLSRRLLQRLAERFEAAGLAPAEFIVVHPWATPAEFAGLLRRADVFLDTIGFSGFNTILLAVECGVPIVTYRGRFMRGRFGSAILERLGLPERVAETDAEYVEFAARLASDPVLNGQVRAAMSSRKGGLYRDGESIAALQEFLSDV